jgi:hypothetical protein
MSGAPKGLHGASWIKEMCWQHEGYCSGNRLIIIFQCAAVEMCFFLQDVSRIKRNKNVHHHGPKPQLIQLNLSDQIDFND